jgi:hypothetical protein
LTKLNNLQKVKGFIYVFITALLLYYLVKKFYFSLSSRVTDLESLNLQLQKQKEELIHSTLNLEESEKRFGDLFDMCPLPMWVYSKQTYKFMDVIVAAINHYAYSKEEFLSMTIFDIRPKEDSERSVSGQRSTRPHQGGVGQALQADVPVYRRRDRGGVPAEHGVLAGGASEDLSGLSEGVRAPAGVDADPA